MGLFQNIGNQITKGYRANLDNNRKQAYLNQQQDNITRRNAQVFPNTKNPFEHPSRDNYNTYKYDYFSGTDCKVFFGDVWVDDIITIQYNVNQTKLPVYNYASQYYDAILKGQVIVQGSLAISFKEVGYLNVINHLIENQRSGSKKAISEKIRKYNIEAKYGLAEYNPGLNVATEGNDKNYVIYSPNGTPSFIRQEQTIEQILESKIVGEGLSKQLLGPDQTKSRDFEDFAELLEDTIWGDSNGRPYFAPPLELKRADELDYDSVSKGIKIANGDNYSDVLNILLTFGDINDFRAEHTYVALNDVHFTSSSMVVSPNGEPIAEMYSFVARDINKALSKELLAISPVNLNKYNPEFDEVKASSIEAIDQALERENGLVENITIRILSYLPIGGKWTPDGNTTFDILNNAPGSDDTITRLNNSEQSFGDYLEKKQFSPDAVKSRRFQDVKQARYLDTVNRQHQFSQSLPVLDQLIQMIEREFNEIRLSEVGGRNKRSNIDNNNSQYLVEVTVNFRRGEEKVNMVLAQAIPSTLTYRVISPTRNQFKANNIISREDLWRGIAKPATGEELFLEDNQQELNRIRTARRQAIDQLNEVTDNLDSLRDKRLEELRKQKARINQDIEKSRQLQNELDSSETATNEYIKTKQIIEINKQIEALESSDKVDDLITLRGRERAQYEALSATESNLTQDLDALEGSYIEREFIGLEVEDQIQKQGEQNQISQKAVSERRQSVETSVASDKEKQKKLEEKIAEDESKRLRDQQLKVLSEQEETRQESINSEKIIRERYDKINSVDDKSKIKSPFGVSDVTGVNNVGPTYEDILNADFKFQLAKQNDKGDTIEVVRTQTSINHAFSGISQGRYLSIKGPDGNYYAEAGVNLTDQRRAELLLNPGQSRLRIAANDIFATGGEEVPAPFEGTVTARSEDAIKVRNPYTGKEFLFAHVYADRIPTKITTETFLPVKERHLHIQAEIGDSETQFSSEKEFDDTIRKYYEQQSRINNN